MRALLRDLYVAAVALERAAERETTREQAREIALWALDKIEGSRAGRRP